VCDDREAGVSSEIGPTVDPSGRRGLVSLAPASDATAEADSGEGSIDPLRVEIYVEVPLNIDGDSATGALLALWSTCEQLPRVGEQLVLMETGNLDEAPDRVDLSGVYAQFDGEDCWTATVTRVRHSFGRVLRDGKAASGERRQESVHVYAVANALVLSREERDALCGVADSIGWEAWGWHSEPETRA
jgi:hypothetical protein